MSGAVAVRVVQAQWAKAYEEERKGLTRQRTGRMVEVGVVEGKIDLAALAEGIEVACIEFAAEGYAVVSVTAIMSGATKHGENVTKNPGTGFYDTPGYSSGFSYTEGVVVTAVRNA